MAKYRYKVKLELKSRTKENPELRSLLFYGGWGGTEIRLVQKIHYDKDEPFVGYEAGLQVEPYISHGMGLTQFAILTHVYHIDDLCNLLQAVKYFCNKSEPCWKKKLTKQKNKLLQENKL